VVTNSRRKGAEGEREFAAYLRERGHFARRGQQYAGGPDSPDIVTDLPMHFEVKRVQRLDLQGAMLQAVTEAPKDKTPIVAHRRNREQWLVTLRADDFFDLIGEQA
jgi:Holliday junction resolvase